MNKMDQRIFLLTVLVAVFVAISIGQCLVTMNLHRDLAAVNVKMIQLENTKNSNLEIMARFDKRVKEAEIKVEEVKWYQEHISEKDAMITGNRQNILELWQCVEELNNRR